MPNATAIQTTSAFGLASWLASVAGVTAEASDAIVAADLATFTRFIATAMAMRNQQKRRKDGQLGSQRHRLAFLPEQSTDLRMTLFRCTCRWNERKALSVSNTGRVHSADTKLTL